MQCFICVAYLMIIATAHPPKDREITKAIEKRSIFNDVIQSLRIRAHLPEDINLNDENNIGENYDTYGIENESLQLPNDLNFMPRRNDRIEMPPMKYRFPKNLKSNDSFDNVESPKDEIVVYVNTPEEDSETSSTTQKPKKQKRPRPPTHKNKNTIAMQNDDIPGTAATNDKPFTNTMGGLSQIGHRESQTVVKPTVIVNFRGSVMHRESDIRLERRRNENSTIIPQNIFNINQEIKVERNDAMDIIGEMKKSLNVKQDMNIGETRKSQIEEDMMMCETSSSKDNKKSNRSDRTNKSSDSFSKKRAAGIPDIKKKFTDYSRLGTLIAAEEQQMTM
ncbi:unnamed protein product [Euphydryas editha]|uniref:Uncharacterized protein n=1 Tax=Euphydryas editha TaxID=104508 RepID=A0AAU9VE45_EUPED|nr:unnamed protein product [Euphydryas editha]